MAALTERLEVLHVQSTRVTIRIAPVKGSYVVTMGRPCSSTNLTGGMAAEERLRESCPGRVVPAINRVSSSVDITGTTVGGGVMAPGNSAGKTEYTSVHAVVCTTTLHFNLSPQFL